MESHDGISQGLAYVWTLGIALVTGVFKYLQRFTATPRPAFDWIIFSVQVGTSIVAGFVASWLFSARHVDPDLSKAAVALAGWGGAEFIAFMERKLRGAQTET